MLTITRTYVYQPPVASEGKDWKGKSRDHTTNKTDELAATKMMEEVRWR